MKDGGHDPRDERSAEDELRPVIAVPRAGLPPWAILGGACALAGMLFVVLDGHRRQVSVPNLDHRTGAPSGGFVPPPPLHLAESRPPTPVATILVPDTMREAGPRLASFPPLSPAQAAPPPPMMTYPVSPPTPVFSGNLKEPALVADLVGPDGPGQSTGGPAPAGGAVSEGDDAPARAVIIRRRATLVPQGTLVPATLETPIDSTRPGMVRAIVSRDVRGFDGSRILVTRGSRLIGEYRADIQSGQKRILITWSRLIRSDGVAIRIGSPAADALGGAGVPGRVDNHFFARFTGAVLQSALTIGTNLASPPGSSSVIIGAPNELANSAGQALLPGNDLRPTIKVRPGASISVFVARDLDFSGVSGRE